MKTYAVMIKATVRKTIEVRAESIAEAEDTAHDFFSVVNNGEEESYDQETISTKEI